MSPTRMGTKANFSPSLSLPSSIYDCALDPSRWEQTLAEREIELGKLLLPHLRRATMISKVLDVRTIESARMLKRLMRSDVPSY